MTKVKTEEKNKRIDYARWDPTLNPKLIMLGIFKMGLQVDTTHHKDKTVKETNPKYARFQICVSIEEPKNLGQLPQLPAKGRSVSFDL